MSVVDHLRAAEAAEKGQCPACQATLLHHWGRHTGLWCVYHPQLGLCVLRDKATDRFETADEARDAFVALNFQARRRAASAAELSAWLSEWKSKPAEPKAA